MLHAFGSHRQHIRTGCLHVRHQCLLLCNSMRAVRSLRDEICYDCSSYNLRILYYHRLGTALDCHGCLPRLVCKRPDHTRYVAERQKLQGLGNGRRAA